MRLETDQLYRGGPRVWLRATRPRTLSASIVPVLVGSATAARLGAFHRGLFVATLAAAMLIQIGSNLANDYFDFRNGKDTAARLGPPRVTQSGLLAPETVKRATVLVLVVAAVVSVPVVVAGGWAILITGLACIAAAVLYTGGPWPFGYHALGDVGAFLFFGPVGVCGTVYVQAGLLTGASVLNALPVGFLIAAILVVNNLRDIDTDRAVDKRTLAVLIGRRATRAEYLLLLLAAFVIPLVDKPLHPTLHWFWLPWLTLPLALLTSRAVLRDEGRKLNQSLAGTAQLNLLFGAAFALSLLLQ